MRARASAFSCVASLWVLGGCSGGSTDPSFLMALTITGGNSQTGCLLQPLPDSLEVTLTGSDGKPLAGVPVTWKVTGGSATVSNTVRATDPDGRSRVQLTLGLALSPVAVSATAGSSPAAAFSATGRVVPYQIGDSISSTLNGGSCTFLGDGPFDACALTLRGAQTFTVSLRSDSFDAAVEVVDEHFALGGAYNLDSVPGRGVTNAFLKMIAAGGAFGIAAASQNLPAQGTYTLTTAAVPVSADSCLGDVWVTLGIVTHQELKSTDCVDSSGPFYFDLFQMVLAPGQSITVTESSTAFDAELFLHSTSGNVVFDDNSGGGKNARLSYTNSSSGAEQLSILPSTATAGATGAYTLTIDPPMTSTASVVPIVVPLTTRRERLHSRAALRSR